MLWNIISILQIRKKECRGKNNRGTIRTGKCSMTLYDSLFNCWTNSSSCLSAYHSPNWFFFSPHTQSLLPRPVSLLHVLIVLFLHICLTLFLPVFPPLMAQTQITWVASKTTVRKGFSLLWFPIIIGIPFPHHAAASLITSNTETARHAALWAESPPAHFNLWLYQ